MSERLEVMVCSPIIKPERVRVRVRAYATARTSDSRSVAKPK